MDNQSSIKIITKKLEKSFELLASTILVFRGVQKWSYRGFFDYDPVNNAGFIKEFILKVRDQSLQVIYVDLDSGDAQKILCFERSELLEDGNSLSEFMKDHATLHDCAVEGSYYLAGESGEWVIFYDAQYGAGFIFSNNKEVMAAMTSYILQS